MIKFLHKKHMHKSSGNGYKFVIYYDFSEIVLGILLVSLVSFFIYNYLQINLYGHQYTPVESSQSVNPVVPKHTPARMKK